MSGGNGSRDRELVGFVGRQGIVGVGQVMARMEAGRSVSYRRIASCVERGLLERVRLLRDEPTVIRATRQGLDYADLGLPVASVSPGLVRHHLLCADVANRMVRRFGPDAVLSEREIVWRERIEGRQIASVELGVRRRRSLPEKHRADLVVIGKKGRYPIEVELTAKAPARLEALIRAWRAAVGRGEALEVNYFCAPGTTRRAVERAVARAQAGKAVSIWDIEKAVG